MLRPVFTLVLALACIDAVHADSPSRRQKCRPPGDSFNLDDSSDLPVCKTRKKPTFQDELNATWSDIKKTPAQRPAARTRAPASARAPASPVSRRPAMSYESYLKTNAAHPALATRTRPPQEAFKDYSKTAVITGSTLDAENSGKDNSNPNGNPPANGANASVGNAGNASVGTNGASATAPAPQQPNPVFGFDNPNPGGTSNDSPMH